MSKNNLIEPHEPIIKVRNWRNTVCTVGWTNFEVRVDPDGMRTVLSIDPDARFYPQFLTGVLLVVKREFDFWFPDAGGRIDTLAGFHKFYGFCVDGLSKMPDAVISGVLNGFSFEVDCRVDGPLVGWFLVLGVNRE